MQDDRIIYNQELNRLAKLRFTEAVDNWFENAVDDIVNNIDTVDEVIGYILEDEF